MNPSLCRLLAAARLMGTAALFLAATGLHAQAVYKQVDAAGQVTFSDVAPLATTPAAAPRRVRYGSMSVQDARAVDASEATRRLNKAQRERRQGAGATRAEQRGPDATTVGYAYWQRQEKLRETVEQAQRRSNDAHRLIAMRTP
jgi:hypothetical protein